MDISLPKNLEVAPILAGIRNCPTPVVAIGFFLVWLLIWWPIAFPLITRANWHPFKPLSVEQKLPLVSSLYLLVPLLLWAASYLIGLRFATMGLLWQVSSLVEILVGLGIGTIGLLFLFGIQAGLGWIDPKLANGTVIRASILPTLLIGLWISATEESIFRGFLQSLLQRDYAPWVVATIVSLVFAVLHAVWEGREALPQLPGLWLMGMVLTLARSSQGGSLGLAIGLHAGWIWVMATLDSSGAIAPTGQGPKVLTGFGNKPLAGLLGILFLFLTGWSLVISY